MTKILVEVDEHTLARAAARLGTNTNGDTIGLALELAAQGEVAIEAEPRRWDEWADGVGERLTGVDWDHAWR